MAKPHWTLPETGTETGYGCQHTTCTNKATHQWQRAATDTEIQADQTTQGPYGDVARNTEGPHHTAVFACTEHALDPDTAARFHKTHCPAPDDGCGC